jgi:hypothetical protein
MPRSKRDADKARKPDFAREALVACNCSQQANIHNISLRSARRHAIDDPLALQNRVHNELDDGHAVHTSDEGEEVDLTAQNFDPDHEQNHHEQNHDYDHEQNHDNELDDSSDDEKEPLPMFETFTKGVTIDSQPRHCQPARKHMKSQNTSAFFQMNFDNIPNPLRSKLEQLGWQPEVVCGEIQSFLKGSFADGGDCAIAKVKIFKPEGFDPLLMLAESQIDLVDRDHYVYGWVCANDLGDVVGLGKGAPGYPQANINLWSVLRVRCDQHTRF